MLPSLNGLRAFEAAARHMSFTRAAAELNVTQTAISHQIRRLEDQLGIPLFVRRNRALALTREAEDYLPSIRSAFEDLRRATDRLRRPENEAVLTVSTTASLATKWLVTRVAAFQDANPGIEVRMTTSSHLVDFQREAVDMAVRYGRGIWPGLRADWLMAEDLYPVCSPLLAPTLRRPEDLARQTLLHTTVSREDWQLWLTAAGLPVSIAKQRGLMFDQPFMATQAAIDGLGVALGVRHLVENDIAAGRLVAPFDLVLPSDAGYYVVAPESVADTPRIAKFRDWLLKSAQPVASAQNFPANTSRAIRKPARAPRGEQANADR
jgi:LysR family glycine cleavage system transcriptional activator